MVPKNLVFQPCIRRGRKPKAVDPPTLLAIAKLYSERVPILSISLAYGLTRSGVYRRLALAKKLGILQLTGETGTASEQQEVEK